MPLSRVTVFNDFIYLKENWDIKGKRDRQIAFSLFLQNVLNSQSWERLKPGACDPILSSHLHGLKHLSIIHVLEQCGLELELKLESRCPNMRAYIPGNTVLSVPESATKTDFHSWEQEVSSHQIRVQKAGLLGGPGLVSTPETCHLIVPTFPEEEIECLRPIRISTRKWIYPQLLFPKHNLCPVFHNTV